ncbi:PHP domain-containing protein [candidate division WOR-3 bacterium]|nr:PHP domain-containing protein [candidate division WOR-3 bacterium]
MDLTFNLHIHTDCSDGAYSPEETVVKAHKIGLKTISITDHDSVAGVLPAQNKAKEVGVEVLSGLELSLEVGDLATCHLLGYLIDVNNNVLISALKMISDSRKDRNIKILRKLEDSGFYLDYAELKGYAGKEENIGRLHIASALAGKGFVKNHHEAFSKFLAKGKKAYFERYRLSIEQGINLIHDAGGIAVLAHPGEGYPSRNIYDKIFFELVDKGLDGVEVFYPSHTHEQRFFFARQAKEFGLIMTAGTDYHGIPGRDMLKLTFEVDYNVLDELKKRGGLYAHA